MMTPLLLLSGLLTMTGPLMCRHLDVGTGTWAP
jgi:hypothetical protein